LIQAKNLDYLLQKNDQKIDIVLKLSVTLETIKKRILERKIIEKRADDHEEIAIKRFETYENNIKPVIDFYKQSNLLRVVNGEATISEISNEISGLIGGIKG
jgi:adenylate kinase